MAGKVGDEPKAICRCVRVPERYQNKKGIGIHGTDSPDTIGRSASHGCIRLANWDAARLVYQVTVGMPLQIY